MTSSRVRQRIIGAAGEVSFTYKLLKHSIDNARMTTDAAAVTAKRAGDVIETPNIIRPEPRRGHVEGEKFTERPRSSARGQTPTSMMRRCGST